MVLLPPSAYFHGELFHCKLFQQPLDPSSRCFGSTEQKTFATVCSFPEFSQFEICFGKLLLAMLELLRFYVESVAAADCEITQCELNVSSQLFSWNLDKFLNRMKCHVIKKWHQWVCFCDSCTDKTTNISLPSNPILFNETSKQYFQNSKTLL